LARVPGTESKLFQVAEYVAEYDSMEYPVRGSSDIDALSLTGREIGFVRRVISYDGKTMTMTVAMGERVRNVAVYDKKEP
jgi:hypothetical protein